MLIKSADGQSAAIAELERIAASKGPEAKRAAEELRIRQAGIKGERESAYLIDFEFAAARNWAVIHDLRIEHQGRVAQIDHLLINRWMDMYVLETKQFRHGVKVTEDGEFLRWNHYRKTYEGIASPLMQNERHIAVLRDVMATLEMPVRLGLRIMPTFHTLVLVASSARIDRPKRFDASRVIKADQLKEKIWKDIDDEGLLVVAKTAAKMVSRETVESVARQLAAQHRPLQRSATSTSSASAGPARSADKSLPAKQSRPVSAESAPSAASRPVCKSCSKTDGEIQHGRYGYYFKCSGCEANTSIKFDCAPGHAPRLRKEGPSFYRECADCGTSVLFHRNA